MANETSEMPTALRSFLVSAAKIPRITQEEEASLAKRIQNGDKEAKDKLVTANLRLLVSVSKQYLGSGMEFEDIIQNGYFGLNHAAETYDPSRGTRFSTHASIWIKKTIGDAIVNTQKSIRLPGHAEDLLREIRTASAEYRQLTGEEPSVEMLAALLNKTPERISEVMNAASAPKSLEAQAGDDEDLTLKNLVKDSSRNTEEEAISNTMLDEAAMYFESGLSVLSEKERTVLIKRYGLDGGEPMTYEELRGEIDPPMTREGLRMVEVRALRKLADPNIDIDSSDER